jgi:hypothetical protein
MQDELITDTFDVPEEPVRTGFHMRFSARSPRDLLLSKWIAQDTHSGRVNISDVIKDLLYAWYIQRYTGDGRLPAPVSTTALPAPVGQGGLSHNGGEGREDPDDPLVRSMLGLNFEDI